MTVEIEIRIKLKRERERKKQFIPTIILTEGITLILNQQDSSLKNYISKKMYMHNKSQKTKKFGSQQKRIDTKHNIR